MPDRMVVTWDDVAGLCHELAGRLSGNRFDAVLAIARGGLVPAALVSQELRLRHVLAAAVASYEGDRRGGSLYFLAFPPDQELAGRSILVIDDIWDTGHTAEMVRRRVLEAGGRPTLAVLHYKPSRSAFPDRRPDVFLRSTDDWVVYPWERDTPARSAAPASPSRRESGAPAGPG